MSKNCPIMGHRIHSSGDYKNPPPPNEHAGLRRYHRERSGDPVTISQTVREAAGRAFLKRMRKEGCPVLALAVAGRHLHGLVEMPNDMHKIRVIAGRGKRDATEAMKPTLAGKVWSEAGEFVRIKDREHHRNAYEYILTRQGADAWTWSYRDGTDVPRFAGFELKTRRRKT